MTTFSILTFTCMFMTVTNNIYFVGNATQPTVQTEKVVIVTSKLPKEGLWYS